MSFPSVVVVAAERGLLLDTLTFEQAQEVLIEAVRRDCPLAVGFLHRKAHEADGGQVFWSEDPNSPLGKQLIRIHASDAVRPLVEQYVCHGKRLQFVNCCSGATGGKDMALEELVRLQIRCQAGPLAFADC